MKNRMQFVLFVLVITLKSSFLIASEGKESKNSSTKENQNGCQPKDQIVFFSLISSSDIRQRESENKIHGLIRNLSYINDGWVKTSDFKEERQNS